MTTVSSNHSSNCANNWSWLTFNLKKSTTSSAKLSETTPNDAMFQLSPRNGMGSIMYGMSRMPRIFVECEHTFVDAWYYMQWEG